MNYTSKSLSILGSLVVATLLTLLFVWAPVLGYATLASVFVLIYVRPFIEVSFNDWRVARIKAARLAKARASVVPVTTGATITSPAVATTSDARHATWFSRLIGLLLGVLAAGAVWYVLMLIPYADESLKRVYAAVVALLLAAIVYTVTANRIRNN